MADIFSWLGDSIGSIGQYLGAASSAANLSNALFGTNAGSSNPIQSPSTPNPTNAALGLALDRSQWPMGFKDDFRSAQSRKAPVEGQLPPPGAMFRDKPENDPYLVSFRRILANNPGNVEPHA